MTLEQRERIQLLDVLRGVALVGILAINIRAFSEPLAAYANPLVYGDHSGLNRLWWGFQYIFIEYKFLAIFSMLFGISTVIICDRLVDKGMPVGATFRRRIFWLFLIGLLHAYFIWIGDILVSYALCSFIPFLFRNSHWQTAFFSGIVMLMVPSIVFAGLMPMMPAEASAEIAAQWSPDADALAEEVAVYQGGWLGQIANRAPLALENQIGGFLMLVMWRAGGMMLIGLGLYRQGFLRGSLSARTYAIWAAFLLLVGLPTVAYGFFVNEAAGWTYEYSFTVGTLWNYWGSILVALGYCALIAAIVKSVPVKGILKAFANMGRMALSNYLFQSIVCTTIFYGYGLGLFGELERFETAFVVLGLVIVQLYLSNWWLKNRDQGPLEALWRRYTYKKQQRVVKPAEETVVETQ